MRRLGILAILLLMATGCAPSGVRVEGAEALPFETAEDWVTYADHLVQIHVESEDRIPPSAEEVDAGEGVIGREVTVTVTKTFWTRTGTSSETPKTMRWSAGGWAFQGEDEEPLLYDGTAAIVVGHDYLVPITYTSLMGDDLSPTEWYPLGGKSVLPFDNGTVGEGETIWLGGSKYDGNSNGETPMRDSAWKQQGDQVAQTLRATKPDPAAAAYMDLSPIERFHAVQRDQHPSQTPGPGER